MDVISNRKAWVIALTFVAVFVGCVAIDESGVTEAPVEDPVGTLRFDELGAALATDPDREVERIVGHVWRFEGPKRTYRGSGRFWDAFSVDLGTSDGIDNRLYLNILSDWDDSRFEAEEIPIVCLITSVGITNNRPTSPDDHGERAIAAKHCRVVEPDANPVSDPP